MTFLPVVERELRVAARRTSTYWVRTGAAFAVILISSWFFLMLHRESPQQVGGMVFGITSAISILYCLFCGVRATADCISQEKRDGTLGLLFLTDLRGYDVILGKLVSTSVDAFYTAFASVPILAIPLLLGGVTIDQVWRMALIAVNALFFSLSVGILISSICTDGRRAMGATFLVILVLNALFPAIAAWASYKQAPEYVMKALLWPCVGYPYFQVFSQIGIKPVDFWPSIVVVHATSWACLAAASIWVPKAWQDRPSDRQRMRFSSSPSSHSRIAFRAKLLDINPFYWLASRQQFKTILIWSVIGFLVLGWFAGLVKYKRDWLEPALYITAGIILNMLIKGWFASEAARQIADERQQGTLELLLSTPLKVPDILNGQRLALQRLFLGPFLLIFIVQFVLMLAGLKEMHAGSERDLWIAVWLGSLVLLPIDLSSCYWVGMWQALTASSYTRAARNTVFRILILPWLLFLGFVLLVSVITFGNSRDPGWPTFVAAWLVIGAVTSISFAAFSRTRLITDFRRKAAARYQPASSIWRRIFGS